MLFVSLQRTSVRFIELDVNFLALTIITLKSNLIGVSQLIYHKRETRKSVAVAKGF